ncbi:MAG: hypothetical protein HOP33_12045, partial [Verrucomicrobia bacterium]|nr:hypothetical protein [Verrucomicrobiota bacterium]
MEQPPVMSPPPPIRPPPLPGNFGPPPPPSGWDKAKKFLAPLGIVGLLLLKFGAKLKFILIPVAKFFPVILKTGGTMILSIGAYAMMLGVWFAVGFVLLIFVH